MKNMSSYRRCLQRLVFMVALCAMACRTPPGWAQPATVTSPPQDDAAAAAMDQKQEDPTEEETPQTPKLRARTQQDNERIAEEKEQAQKKTASKHQQQDERAPAPDSNAPFQNAPIIKKIEIAGATPEDSRKANSVIQSREGEQLNPEKQRDDIRRLYNLGLFKPNIVVEAVKTNGGVILRYSVEPNPKVREITVNGNTKVDTKKIINELPVKKGEVYTIQAQNKIRDSVARYYDEKGFADTMVNVEERPAPGNTVDISLAVDEGTKMKIKDLIIKGNNNIRDLLIELRVANKGSWGPFKHYFNETKFQNDLEIIKALYVSKGFLDIEVKRGDFIYAPDQSWVSPVIEIAEGPRYKIGRLEARGYTIFTRDEILGPFRPLQNQYYNTKKFNEAATKVKNMCGDEGFLLCKAEPDFHKDSARGVVDVDIDVTEGSRIYVGDIKILSQAYPDDMDMGWLRKYYSRFSPPVKDEIVQREVRLRPGQVYRRFEEVRTRERLKSLNVFETVKVNDQMSADTNVRDVVIDVTQGNTGNLIFGVGFGDVEGAFIYANYIERNLFGMARDLRLSVLLGTNAQNVSLTYLDRYFRGTDVAAQFSLYHSNYTRTGSFTETRTGTTAEFTRPLSEYVKDSIRLRLESIDYDLNDQTKPDTPLNNYIAATIRYKLMQDTRDDLFFPTTGHILGGSIESGAADGFLMKFEGQYAKYCALSPNWVFAMNNQLGLMPYTYKDVGYSDRFFLGGSQDLRGFKIYGAGPHDTGNSAIPTGGSTKLLSQFEMRRAISDSITGVAFTDIGMLGQNALDFGTPRASMGAGVRIRLPIAQVALDLGIPVAKQNNDQTQLLHFTMSSAF